MSQRKLKGFVLPTIYLVAISTIVISILVIGRNIRTLNANKETDSETNYIINSITEDVEPVVEETNDKVIKPFSNEEISIIKEFYEKDATEEVQQKALIYYEGTYMQNSGILYSHKEEFEIIATMDGTISNIKEDDLLGMVIEIEHNSKLTTVYQSLKEVKVTVGQTVKMGEVIGISGPNKLNTSTQNQLLFEVFHNGILINPNNYYGQEIKAFSE